MLGRGRNNGNNVVGAYITVVNDQAKLIKFTLDVAEDAPLEDFALGEDLLHGHARHQHTGLALDDTLDDILEKLVIVGSLGGAGIGQQHGVLNQCVASVLAAPNISEMVVAGVTAFATSAQMMVVVVDSAPHVCAALIDVRADGEDDGKQELELLLGHGLEVHAIVVWLHAEAHASLEGPNPCCLGDFDCADVSVSMLIV